MPYMTTPVPSRPVHWVSGDGVYALEELIHPWHLVLETDALGHCIGRRQHAGQSSCDLPYWRMIVDGKAKIYSLASGPTRLCTLHVALQPPTLIDCEPCRFARKLGDQAYFPALVAAIAHLGVLFPGLRFDNTLGFSAPDILTHCDSDTRRALASRAVPPRGRRTP